MRERRFWLDIVALLLWTAFNLVALNSAHSQAVSLPTQDSIHRDSTSVSGACEAGDVACLRTRVATPDPEAGRLIIIGFVGGFVKHDDTKHPEVKFAEQLRDRYSARIHAEVFGNHSRQKALRQVLRLLDTDGDGRLTSMEKEQARIIIYGHSWGASETVTLARELETRGIPVLLTIQVDRVAKPGQRNGMIPPNVAKAVNFYQSKGMFHGPAEILAEDPSRTKIIGSYRMDYKEHPISCDQYPWYARAFMKSHLEIENDPRVWEQAAFLIDAELLRTRLIDTASTSDQPMLSK